MLRGALYSLSGKGEEVNSLLQKGKGKEGENVFLRPGGDAAGRGRIAKSVYLGEERGEEEGKVIMCQYLIYFLGAEPKGIKKKG